MVSLLTKGLLSKLMIFWLVMYQSDTSQFMIDRKNQCVNIKARPYVVSLRIMATCGAIELIQLMKLISGMLKIITSINAKNAFEIATQ